MQRYTAFARINRASIVMSRVALRYRASIGRVRCESTIAVNSSNDVRPRSRATLFVDAVFPIRLTTWDIRTYLAAFRREEVLDSLTSLLNSINSHGFKLIRVDRAKDKDGGVFVHFEYEDQSVPSKEGSHTLAEVVDAIRARAREAGGLPSWFGWGTSNVWAVQGEPWTEDMHRYASKTVKVEFEGPDVHQEKLYRMFRPFGRIEDITRPQLVPAGTLRSSMVHFRRVRSAVRAQNCLHGFTVSGAGAGAGAGTRLSIVYEQALKGHVVRDWLSNHPKIVLPLLAFLLGTLTYTIFDPIRSWMVQARMESWFNYRDYRLVQWFRQNTIGRLFDVSSAYPEGAQNTVVWEERKEAEGMLERYLIDVPNTVAFVHGPAGSGKSSVINRLLKNLHRPTIIIDCAAIYNANSDSAVLRQVAVQTGYFPIFSGLAWVSSMIDLASVGLIGQKAGFSKSLDEQLKDVLDVVGSALRGVNSSHADRIRSASARERTAERRRLDEAVRLERIRRGVFHDPRLDCVSGNGLMSEVGIGDERLEDDFEPRTTWEVKTADHPENVKTRSEPPANDISGFPIVVLKNYDAKGAVKREAILNVLATWSAALVENQIAHVVVASDNKESMKRLTKALGSRPLETIPLTDADATSALNIVASRLDVARSGTSLSPRDIEQLSRLGGRSSDLEVLVHKVKNGQTIQQAVEDIVTRTMSELRKGVFGDDNEDAKALPWGREQAWSVISKLSRRSEIPYPDTLLNFPFKGDDAPLREMEKAELITIVTDDGFPVCIRPGRPVYRYVFERLVNDSLFASSQEIATNEKRITSAEATIKACEEELLKLRTIGLEAGRSIWHGKGAISRRADVLLHKMEQAVENIEKLERVNVRLKKILASEGAGRGRSGDS